MKKKVKKFGRGGDILTGLGAGLMGYALYKKLKGEDKDEKEPEAVGGPGRRARTIEEQTGRKAEPKAESREEYLEKRGAKPIKTTGTFEGPDTTPPDLDYKNKTPKSTVKKVTPAAQSTKTEPRAKATDKVGAGYENVGKTAPKSVVFKDATTSAPKASAPAEAPAKIGSQGPFKFDSKPDLSVPKAFDMKSGNKTVYGTDTTSVFQKQAARARAEAEEKAAKEREAAEAAKRRKGASEIKYDEMGNPMKKGGAVKKYASGGTVKSSASKRADGIAQRGKTRGRIY
jgi:hypothetical protein